MGPLTAIVGTRLYLDANIIIYAVDGPDVLPAALRVRQRMALLSLTSYNGPATAASIAAGVES